MSRTDNEEALRMLLDRLKHLDPRVVHIGYRNTITVRFKKRWLKTVRVGDKDGMSKFMYRWKIGIGPTELPNGVSDRHTGFQYTKKELESLAKRIEQYYEAEL